MKSYKLKFIVILTAILFIGTGVSWADGFRGKGHRYHGKGNHDKNLYKQKHHHRGYKKHFYGHHRKPHRYYGHRPGYRHYYPKGFHRPGYRPDYPKHQYRNRFKHQFYRHGFHKEHYAFGLSIFEPNIAFGFSVKGHK